MLPRARCAALLTTRRVLLPRRGQYGMALATRPKVDVVDGKTRPGSRPSATHYFDEFMRAPSIENACRVMKHEGDADAVWIVFEHIVKSNRLQPDDTFFKAMMKFCQELLPYWAPKVLDIAMARGIPSKVLFRTFVSACSKTYPPLLVQLLDRYKKYGPHDYGTICHVAQVCIAAEDRIAALHIISDALRRKADASEDALFLFAGCCADAESPSGADIAERILHRIRLKRVTPPRNRLIFGNLIEALLGQGRFQSAVSALSLMDDIGLPPSEQIFSSVVSALAIADRIDQAMSVFQNMVRRDLSVSYHVLSDLIAACGRRSNALAIKTLHEYAIGSGMLDNDSVVCAFVTAYDQVNDIDAAEEVFRGRYDAVLFLDPQAASAMIRAYGRHGQLDKALELFERARLPPGTRVDAAIYNSTIVALAKAGQDARAYSLFQTMLEQIDDAPDAGVVAALVTALGSRYQLAAVQALHRYAGERQLTNEDVRVSLIEAYARCGVIGAAEQLFFEDPAPSVEAFAAIISAYGSHGMLSNALAMYEQFKATGMVVHPDQGMLVALLTASSLAGDLDRFNALSSEFEHRWGIRLGRDSRVIVNCLIVLYGRLGMLDDAEQLALSSTNVDIDSLLTILSACRKHGDVRRAERIFDRILSGDLSSASSRRLQSAACHLMSSVYEHAGRMSDCVRVRDEMAARGIPDRTSRTLLLAPSETLEFQSDDDRYRTDCNLRNQHWRLVQDLDHDPGDPDWLRSELVAFAYAVNVLAPYDAIRLVTSAVMPPGAHDAVKRAAVVYRRDVYVRDPHRQHCFREGRCSCGDYW